jgi:hypothetical protein
MADKDMRKMALALITPAVAVLALVAMPAQAADEPLNFHNYDYYVEVGRDVTITLNHKAMGGVFDASLCSVNTAGKAEWCQHIQDWKVGESWTKPVRRGQHMAVFSIERGHGSGVADRGEPGRPATAGRTGVIAFYAGSGFRVDFTVR